MLVSSQIMSGEVDGFLTAFKCLQLVISPVALSVQVLTLDAQVIPFIPAKFTSLIILIGVFFALGFVSQVITHLVQRYQDRYKAFVPALNGQKRWSRTQRGSFQWLRSRVDTLSEGRAGKTAETDRDRMS
jgi:hypothetical protein